MAATQYGTTLVIGATALTGYVIESADTGDFEVAQEDVIEGVNGTIATRVIWARYPTLNLSLISVGTVSTQAAADFPKGLKCALTFSYAGLTLSSCICDDVKISNAKGGQKVTVTLKNIGV